MPSLSLKMLCVGVALAALGGVGEALGQYQVLWTPTDGDYNVDGNWDLGIVPDTEYDAYADISNGGIARLSSVAPNAAQVIIGNQAGQSGTLIIQNGGSLATSYLAGNVSTPGFNVGISGTGTLEVQAGASIAGGYLQINSGSTASFAGTTLNPTTVAFGLGGEDQISQNGTTVSAGSTLRITGPGVDYSSSAYNMATGSTLVAELTAASHSPIKVADSISVAGTLRVELNGYSPSVGDTWNLFDATSINGDFDDIDLSGLPSLSLGQAYSFQTVADAGSVNGVYGQLSVEQQLILQVDRDTNQMSIVSGSASPIAIDGYAITSLQGGLNPAGWTSLQDSGSGDWTESPSNGSKNALAELEPRGTRNVTSSSPVNLGAVFDLPDATAFKVDREDIAFEYYLPDGTVVEAQVMYVGDKMYNDVVLVVDPVDGDVVLQNQSNLSITIDGYNIHSDSSSLRPNDWNSLDDQDAVDGTWDEAGVTASEFSSNMADDLSELQSGAATLLNGGATYDLGSLFRTTGSGGTQDLSFSYLIEGDNYFTEGVVVYRDVDFQQVSGDYNGDGMVDQADYVVWRNNLGNSVTAGTGADGNGNGTVDVADYQVWKTNFGTTATASISSLNGAAVPEPSTVVLLALAGMAVGLRRKLA